MFTNETKELFTATVAYALFASTIIIVNKLTVQVLAAPTFILLVKNVFISVFIFILKRARILKLEEVSKENIIQILPTALGLLALVYANIKTLQYANVDTFVVFLSSTPIVTSICDYLFLGRTLPNARSCVALFLMVGGTIGYVLLNSSYKVSAYVWISIWYLVFVFDQTYIKYFCDSTTMSIWMRTYVTHIIGAVVLIIIYLVTISIQPAIHLTYYSAGLLLLSCFMSAGMSYSSFKLREITSSTSYTIIGILCRIVSVVINLLIWNKHTSPSGLGTLMVCAVGGLIYQQAPLREKKAVKYEKISSEENEIEMGIK